MKPRLSTILWWNLSSQCAVAGSRTQDQKQMRCSPYPVNTFSQLSIPDDSPLPQAFVPVSEVQLQPTSSLCTQSPTCSCFRNGDMRPEDSALYT